MSGKITINEVHSSFSGDIANEISLSNQNILHNWDFSNPVNQRNSASYITGYSIDRWGLDINNGGVELSVQSGFIRLKQTNVTGGTYSQSMYQRIENPQIYSGKTVTLSIEHKNAKNSQMLIYAGSGVIPSSVKVLPVSSDWSITSVTVTLPTMTSAQALMVFIYTDISGTLGYVDYRRIKLEIGTKSTLANDTPMDYGRELSTCQRYFKVLNGYVQGIDDYWTGGNYLMTRINKLNMRATPTVTLVGTPNDANGYYVAPANGGTAMTGVTFTCGAMSKDAIWIKAYKSGMTPSRDYVIVFNENNKILLSADL